MKRFVISVVILTVIIFSSLKSVCYLKSTTETLVDKIDSINLCVKSDNINSAFEETKKLEALWSDKKDVFVMFVNNNDIDDITYSISKLMPLLEYKDKSEFCSNLNYTKSLIMSIYDNDSISLNNII